ncbi:DUF4133 domain-containing protein [Mucilaginibacter paludis]|uniref:DUF4133 domain-containing protein n=1 Tax=Mucilaginibacter paludis DSM 18603 TaxID=714943 RepID=H1YAH5_9SPHI|nr:DUF4133 domain-containing protein [Mucilaginibacter paludis]EHQ27018.1 hypothetical protein Mucpa_2910 [Mucilaginibacter paludis DSM 18603]
MTNSIYPINKGINKSIEFRGLKAQYIWYLGGGILGLMFLYAILFLIGVNSFVCMAIILIGGTVVVVKVYAMSNKYGEYGMMKVMAKRMLPKVLKSSSRKVFIQLKGG